MKEKLGLGTFPSPLMTATFPLTKTSLGAETNPEAETSPRITNIPENSPETDPGPESPDQW